MTTNATPQSAAMPFQLFDRHAAFTEEMMDTWMAICNKVEEIDMDRFVNGGPRLRMLRNNMSGMWDGYLYSNLISLATDGGVDEETISALRGFTNRVQEYIDANS